MLFATVPCISENWLFEMCIEWMQKSGANTILWNEFENQPANLLIWMCFCKNLGKAGSSDAMLRTTEVVKVLEKGCDVEMLGRIFISPLLKISL